MATEIVIVDDQELMRLGFRMVLDSQPDLRVTGEAADGEEAVRVAMRLRPDIVLMDVRMPHLDGIQATERLVAADPDVRVLLVTTFDREDYRESGVRAGAWGLLLKDVPSDGLIAAVRAIAAGERLADAGHGVPC